MNAVDPDGIDCKVLLDDFRHGKIYEMEKIPGYEKSFVTRTITSKPFYWSTHKAEIDKARATSFTKGLYYEKQLSHRIMETFDEKFSKNEETIFLDVGGNIGWFSLLAAAYGASKVYTFEPNPSNMVRLCESLSLNNWLHDDRSKDIVIPILKGVGNASTRSKLYRANEYNPGSFTFSRQIAKQSFRTDNVTIVADDTVIDTDGLVGEIDIVTLDDFADRHGWFTSKPTIAFFKLDVEGYEPYIMEGAIKLFNSRIIEYFNMEMKQDVRVSEKRKMLNLLYNAGYDLHMHGHFFGPNNKVDKIYDTVNELVVDLQDGKYGDNLLFRRSWVPPWWMG